MKKFTYHTFILVFALIFSSCTFSTKGEGNIDVKEIKLNNVRQISAKGNYRLIYLYDDQNPRIIIETYKNLIDNLKIDNSGGQLSISESRNVKDTDLYNIYIYNPEIERFDLHNTVNIDVNSQLRVSKLAITLSDDSKFLGNNIVVDELNVKISNGAKINLQGTGSKLVLSAGDESDFSAPFFNVSEARIQLSNVATAELTVRSKLTGKISDNSKLTLIGNPSKDIKQTDLAEINYKQ
ncbi:MAG: DUF2807 domain-containing protein [Flavobacteriaceae bacterium]|jgi:hypothetical protein|nr:DUF2807 domain-containing protein [Flavobacteriaceae bacterium]